MVDTDAPPICALSTAIVTRIISHLTAKEITRMSKVCKRLKTVSESRPINVIWWKLCMSKWYNPDDAPKTMLNKKCDWKKMYYSAGFPDDSVRKESVMDIPTRKQKLEQQRLEAQRAEEEAANEPTKEEMRCYYKQFRSKPRGKRPTHVDREFFDQ